MTEQLAAPDAVYARQRWIPLHRVDYAKEASEILHEHGGLNGTKIYEKRHQARWQAQALIRLLVELRMFERKELSEHTEKRHGGYIWSVEYLGGGSL